VVANALRLRRFGRHARRPTAAPMSRLIQQEES